MSRSKLISLGFQVVNTRTGEKLSPVFARREPARVLCAALYAADPSLTCGVRQLEEYVAAETTKRDIEKMRQAAQGRNGNE